MGLYFLEKKCHRISEISFLPSLKAKLLFPVCDEIPCTLSLKSLHRLSSVCYKTTQTTGGVGVAGDVFCYGPWL